MHARAPGLDRDVDGPLNHLGHVADERGVGVGADLDPASVERLADEHHVAVTAATVVAGARDGAHRRRRGSPRRWSVRQRSSTNVGSVVADDAGVAAHLGGQDSPTETQREKATSSSATCSSTSTASDASRTVAAHPVATAGSSSAVQAVAHTSTDARQHRHLATGRRRTGELVRRSSRHHQCSHPHGPAQVPAILAGRWRRGRVAEATACKAVYPGSIPGVASTDGPHRGDAMGLVASRAPSGPCSTPARPRPGRTGAIGGSQPYHTVSHDGPGESDRVTSPTSGQQRVRPSAGSPTPPSGRDGTEPTYSNVRTTSEAGRRVDRRR